MGKKVSKILILGMAVLFVLVAAQAVAQVGGTSGEKVIDLKDLSPLGTCGKLDCILVKILDFVFYLAIPLTSIMVLWGGFQILTAAGNPERVKTGGKTVLYAAVGFAVVILSKAVAFLITDIISK